jgi:hypothetical protein
MHQVVDQVESEPEGLKKLQQMNHAQDGECRQ